MKNDPWRGRYPMKKTFDAREELNRIDLYREIGFPDDEIDHFRAWCKIIIIIDNNPSHISDVARINARRMRREWVERIYNLFAHVHGDKEIEPSVDDMLTFLIEREEKINDQ